MEWRRFLAATSARGRAAIADYVAHEFMPQPRRDSDLFLVEFPKSGVTWLTFLIANINVLLSRNERDVTFFNINDFVPDVQVNGRVRDPSTRDSDYRCFKSHSPYTRNYRKVFYLVRDPRHVMPSYWSFLTALGAWQGSLEEFVKHPEYGIRAWNKHVVGWLNGVDAAASFSLVRYEDLQSNTDQELGRLAKLLGLRVTQEILVQAIERSSIDYMRASEALANEGHPRLRSFEFVRRGKVGGPREAISPELCRIIDAEAGGTMKLLGYSLTDESR